MLLPIVMFVLSAGPKPLIRAHAHNDYEHTRPLLDALEQGFCSVEADIYLVDGELRVGHDRKDLVPGKTLEKLYLDPLSAQVRAHHGHVYEERAPVTLLVDIKTDGEAVYAELRKRLPKYRSMLSEYKAPSRPGSKAVTQRAITIILSGDRPVETVRKEAQRYVFIDGRMPDLADGAKLDPGLIPLVSDDLRTYIGWLGQGLPSPSQTEKIKSAVEQAHLAGVRIRFWDTPDRAEIWELLYDCGVDLLNTDDLPGMAGFLRSK